jgi:dienelactone hydrolase
MKVDLAELWSMDEIRKLPLDVEVVSRYEEKGYRVDEMYFTSEMTPNGPNRIFCAFARSMRPSRLMPVVLMIHGGGDHAGAAMALWSAQNQKNIMVIFVDWSGEFVPGTAHYTKWRHPFPNPYAETARVVPTLKDNPLYHIVVGLRRALDFVSQQPDVDMTRVVAFGGSWGGYFGLLLAGIDSRVGCVLSWVGAGGWRDSHNGLSKPVEDLPEDQRELWFAAYDAIAYAPHTKAAVLFRSDANDYYFWFGGLQQNYKALPGKKHLVITPNCDHGFGGPQIVDGSWWWVRQYITGKAEFPEIVPGSLSSNGRKYTWRASGPKEVTSAKLYWSPGDVVWSGRYWVEIPAVKRFGKWRAKIPREFKELSGEIYVTVFGKDGLPASSLTQPREGRDPRTVAGPLWTENGLWDTQRGADAWRPIGYTASKLEVTSPGSFKLSPEDKQTHFAVLTNSVILASGRAPEFAGIRLKLNGEGKGGELAVRLCRDSRSNKELPYTTVVDYQAGETTVDLPWSAFKGPDGAPTNPYPFDALILEGDREDGSVFMVETIELYK